MAKSGEGLIIVFADNFDIKIIARALHFPGATATNLETYLNNPANEEIILEDATIYQRKSKKIFELLAAVSAQAIKISHIVMAHRKSEELVFAPVHGKTTRLQVKFRMKGLERGLTGTVDLPGDYVPEGEIEKLIHLTNSLKNKRFIPFYNVHQKADEHYFKDLFLAENRNIDKFLLNRTDSSVFSKEILKPENY